MFCIFFGDSWIHAWKTLGSWLSRGIKYFRIMKTLFVYSSDRRNLKYLVLFLREKDNDLTMEFIIELQFFWKELSPGLRKWVFRKTTFLPLTFTCKVALLFSGWLIKQRSADNRPSSHHIRQATWLLYYLLWVGCWMLMLEIVIEANKAKKEDYESWIKWHGGQLLKPSALRIQQRSSLDCDCLATDILKYWHGGTSWEQHHWLAAGCRLHSCHQEHRTGQTGHLGLPRQKEAPAAWSDRDSPFAHVANF